MRCPTLGELPPAPPGKTGWPWTEASSLLPDTTANGHPWPRISIVTPSFNQGVYIEESIRSVLLQGYPDLEYFIFDGGSTDSSVEIIKKYEPWLTYWASEPDRGQSHAINKGLARSTGQLFNWQNADDVLTLNSLAATAAAMAEHPEASYVHGYAISIDEQSNILFYNDELFKGKTGYVPDLAWSVANLKGGYQPGCLMDRKLVKDIGGVDESIEFVMDLDLCLRLALVRPPFYIHYPLVYFRQHPASKSLSRYDEKADSRLVVADKLFRRKDLPSPIRKLRRRATATAHQYAWKCYTEVRMHRFVLWHVLRSIFYAPLQQWPARLSTIYQTARDISVSMASLFRRNKKADEV